MKSFTYLVIFLRCEYCRAQKLTSHLIQTPYLEFLFWVSDARPFPFNLSVLPSKTINLKQHEKNLSASASIKQYTNGIIATQ